MQSAIGNFDSQVLFYVNCFADMTKMLIFAPKSQYRAEKYGTETTKIFRETGGNAQFLNGCEGTVHHSEHPLSPDSPVGERLPTATLPAQQPRSVAY